MMRKRETRWAIYVCVLLLFALLAWACGKPVESDPETGTGTETAEVKPSSELGNETKESESGIEKSESETKEPESKADDAESQTPEAQDRETESTVPSGEETPSGETEALSTYVYHIDELDVDLEIPENLYVYRINGVYEDWTGKDNVHDFSTWILVTDKEYGGKEALEESLTENYAEVAEHVWFIAEIIPKELYPVKYASGGMHPVIISCAVLYRMTETGYYCNAERCTNYLSKEYYGVGSGRYRGYHWTEHSQKRTPEENKLTEKWTKAIEEKTVTMPFFFLEQMNPYMNDYVEWEDRFRTTICDDRFWEVYCQAVEELINFPEKYKYTDEKSLSLIEQEIEKRKEFIGNVKRFESWEASITDIYVDSEADIYIRAYCYAKYVVVREYRQEIGWHYAQREITLNDVIVLLTDWSKGQRSFETFIEDSGFEGDYHFAGNTDWLCDLTKAREYVVSRRAQEGR